MMLRKEYWSQVSDFLEPPLDSRTIKMWTPYRIIGQAHFNLRNETGDNLKGRAVSVNFKRHHATDHRKSVHVKVEILYLHSRLAALILGMPFQIFANSHLQFFESFKKLLIE